MDSMQMLKYVVTAVLKPKNVPIKPLSINVEITNCCNLSCRMCYRDEITAHPSSMTLDQFKFIYDQIESPHVALHGYGEPLLNQDLFNILRYLKSKFVKTTVTSNMVLLKDWMVPEMLKGDLDLLKISLDTQNKEIYKIIRGTDDFEKVVDNI